MPQKSVLATITGRVQGVGFRDWTMREANSLDLRGWVRNEADGSVSALLCGTEDAVSAMLDLLRAGPPLADVASVTERPSPATDIPPDFRQQR